MNGEDEKYCSWSPVYTLLALVIAYLIVTVGWYTTYYGVFKSLKFDIKTSKDELVAKYLFTESLSQLAKRKFAQEHNIQNLWELNGDDLAYFKVCNQT